MGYIVPPKPGSGQDDPAIRGLEIQIAMWLIAMPFVVISVVVILYAITFGHR